MLQGEDVASDKEEVATRLHGNEPAAWDVDPMSVVEMFHGGTCRCLELRRSAVSSAWTCAELCTNLYDGLIAMRSSFSHDEIQIHATVAHNLLQG